jgi:hypothetical protein
MRTIDIPRNPAPEKMKRMRPGDGNSYPCVICGIAVTKPKFMCHMIGGGGVALHPDDENLFAQDAEAQRGDLGCQPIGTDCLRRYPEMKPFAFAQ